MKSKTFYVAAFHIVCWILVALPAVVFVPQHVRWDTGIYLLRLCLPVLLCLVFYLNYLWLVPRFFVNRKLGVYVCVNLALVVVFALCMECIVSLIHEAEFAVGMAPPLPDRALPPSLMVMAFSVVKNMFPFILSAALATSLRLAMRWEEAEKGRKEMEIRKTEAELDNLRNQVNPHFLLNTLNNIYALISFDADKAQRAVLSLSALLRQMLYGGKGNSVSLKDEADFISNYVELMRLRLSRNVKVDFTASVPEGDAVRIAPFILISIVENAFKHGVSTAKPCFVSISITSDGESIVCDVRNSNFPKNDTDRSGHGIGLEQVARRLDIAYAGKYQWDSGVSGNGGVYYSKITIYDTKLCNNR